MWEELLNRGWGFDGHITDKNEKMGRNTEYLIERFDYNWPKQEKACRENKCLY